MMWRAISATLTLALAALIAITLRSYGPDDSAYTILCDNIYTVDESHPHINSFSVNKQGLFSSAAATASWFGFNLGSPKRVITLPPNAIVIPGISDSHAHLIHAGFKMDLSLTECKSPQEVITTVRNYVLNNPDILQNKSHWIRGMGWDQTKWPGKSFPHAYLFDSDPILKDRPIHLLRTDGHAAWVSPTVLSLTPLPPSKKTKIPGGHIFKGPQGKPTGVFLDSAMSLIPVPEWSEEEKRGYVLGAVGEAIRVGITGVHDAGVSVGDFEVMKQMDDDGELPLRVYAMSHHPSLNNTLPKKYHSKSHRLTMQSIKLTADGALGSWGAALLRPYNDNYSSVGLMSGMMDDRDALRDLVKGFWKGGWQVNTHCIGDRANQLMLDIYQDIIQDDTLDVDVGVWRPRIEHAQIMTEGDLKRIGELGVIASVQPTHATSDMWYAERRIGADRLKGAYAYQTLLQASPKKILPLGSDFPVEGINPLLGFYAAVTRLAPDGTSPHGSEGWYPNERLTRPQALKGMTLDPAYASFTETTLGSITQGKKADFVVLDRDIMNEEKVGVREILKAKVLATVVDGVVVYGSL